jgi:phospho-N-acetylmuramoyl-pentapeptide-transferase
MNVELQPMAFASLVAFALALLLGPLFIPLLRHWKLGQTIRHEGPSRHLTKSGTPTMGGIMIVLACALPFWRLAGGTWDVLIVVVGFLGFGLIGFLDDAIKLFFRRSLGLTAKQKLLGQFVVAACVCAMCVASGHDTTIAIPETFLIWDFGWMYYVVMIFVLVGLANAVNFTDGLDGLLSGTGAIAFAAFAVLALVRSEHEVVFFAAAMVGALLGFLVYNAHPAKVFMGDTGSLAIGGGLGVVAMLTKTEVLLLVIGAVFWLELLSVVIQVVSFRLRKKRVFLMSPLHHHWELVGWSEWRVVVVFWSIALGCACIGVWMGV